MKAKAMARVKLRRDWLTTSERMVAASRAYQAKFRADVPEDLAARSWLVVDISEKLCSFERE